MIIEETDYSIDSFPVSKLEIDILTFVSSLLGAYWETGGFSKFSGAVRNVVEAEYIQKANNYNTLNAFTNSWLLL